MKKSILPSLAFIFLACSFANAQLHYFNAFSLGNNANDRGTSMASDASGNIYCAGEHTYWMDLNPLGSQYIVLNNGAYTTDIYVAKYSQAGILQWGFGIGGSGVDVVSKIILDAAGNVYITGSFEDTVDFDPGILDATRISHGGKDIFIAKYDGSGVFQWVNAIGDAHDERGNDITISANGTSGKIVVTGEYSSHSMDMDPDAATHLIYNNGSTSFTTANCFLAAYNMQSGAYEWSFNIGSLGGASGSRVIAGISGDIYVAGMVGGDSTDFDPGSGSVYVNTGNSSMVFLAHYRNVSSSPEFQRVESFGGIYGETANSLAIDDAGSVYMGGYFNSDSMDIDPGPGEYYLHNYPNGVQDIYVAKFDTGGILTWAFAVGGYYSEVAQDLVVDHTGHLFITGNFGDTVDFDPGISAHYLIGQLGSDGYLAEYDQEGHFIDVIPFHGNGNQFGLGLCIIPNHKVGVTGWFSSDTIDFDPGPDVHNLFVNGGNTTWLDAFVGVYDYSWEGISEADRNDGVIVFPVPSDAYVNVSLKNSASIDEVSLLDMLGNEIFQSAAENRHSSAAIKINVSNLAAGMYFLRVRSGAEIHSGKLIRK